MEVSKIDFSYLSCKYDKDLLIGWIKFKFGLWNDNCVTKFPSDNAMILVQ